MNRESKKIQSALSAEEKSDQKIRLWTIAIQLALYAALFIGGAILSLVALKIGASVVHGTM